MNPPGAVRNGCPAPSPAQLALALAIVKSKPASIDVKEHILQIRTQIKPAKNSQRMLASEKYFDSVAFWKRAYAESEAAQSKLLDRIYDLEQRNESLLVKLKPESADGHVQGSEKRKMSSDPGASAAAARKRVKTGVSARPSTSGTGRGKLDEFIIQDLKYEEASVAPFMRQLYTLHQTLQKKPNYSVIVLNSVNLCKAAEAAVLTAIHNTTAASNRPKATTDGLKEQEPDPISVIWALERAYELLCQGLNKLANSTEGRKHEGHVIYHLVSLFETILRALEQRSKAKAKAEGEGTSPQRSSKQSRRQKQPAKSKSKQATAQPAAAEDEVSSSIVRLLATMMLSGSNSVTTHRSLLEGYLFILLRRVGKILCVFEFRDLLLRPDLRADPEKLPLPQGLMQADTDDAAVQAAEMEAKFLIWLLERAMAIVYSFAMKSASNGNGNAAVGEGAASSPPLLTFAKRKLQSTLLKAVFSDDHPLFSDSLRRPRLPAEALSFSLSLRGGGGTAAAEESVLEWFPREVWRLLGWDMLAEGLSK
ncbi:hypothetical protein VTN77DRAFT_3790 [Rasamsonia byssochlamydoides]|uniref:uncharacterized protein n=1 Tax=Rasamsonia byssochlamydoides TaxID=89139 RepID=UPI00374246C8